MPTPKVQIYITRPVADAIDAYREEQDVPNLSRNAAAETLLKQALRQLGIYPKTPPTEEE